MQPPTSTFTTQTALPFRLLVILDDAYAKTAGVSMRELISDVATVEENIGVMLRMKTVHRVLALDAVEHARRVSQERENISWILNAGPDVEAAEWLFGRQLPPRADASPSGPFGAIPEYMKTGRSCHGSEELELAANSGADWALLSPVWNPTSKRPTRPQLGLAEFQRLARAHADLPVFALGGVTPDRVEKALAAGAAGVSSLGYVHSKHARARVEELLRAIDAAGATSGT